MKILVCTDGSEIAKRAVEYAADFAKNYQADLTVMYVIDHETSMKKPVYDKYGDKTHKAKELLEDAKKTIAEKGAEIEVTERIAVGPVSREIVRIAKAEEFDSIVIGTRGLGGLIRMLLGSVAEDVILYAHCPVVVVR
ncbi:MAG: universal stress protein [Thermodesulfobacteriota bacterium]